MIDKIKKKNKQNQRRQRHATILPKCWKTYCLNMKIRMKKKKSTQEKKIQRDHASRKSLMIILEASLKKKDETQK